MKLFVLDNGYIDGSYLIFYRENEAESTDNIVFPVNVFLIQTDDGKNILFDAGVYPGGIRAKSSSFRYQSRKQTIWNQLSLCGLEPKDIDAVVLSHLHYDHAGCLFLFENKDLYVSRLEYDFAMGDEVPDAYCRKDYEIANVRWHLIDQDCELFPGVEAILLPGHTPGMMGLLLQLNQQPVILTQDAVYAEDNYYPKRMIPGLLADEAGYLMSLEKVKALQEKTQAKLIFGHDRKQRETLRLAPQYYE